MQIRDQARVEPSGTRWVDNIVLLSICAPRSITSISIPFPLDVDLPAQLELHVSPPPRSIRIGAQARGLGGVMSPPRYKILA